MAATEDIATILAKADYEDRRIANPDNGWPAWEDAGDLAHTNHRDLAVQRLRRTGINPESTLTTPKPTPPPDKDTDRQPVEGYAGSTTQLASDIARTGYYGHAIQPPRVVAFQPREDHLPNAGEISLKWRPTP